MGITNVSVYWDTHNRNFVDLKTRPDAPLPIKPSVRSSTTLTCAGSLIRHCSSGRASSDGRPGWGKRSLAVRAQDGMAATTGRTVSLLFSQGQGSREAPYSEPATVGQLIPHATPSHRPISPRRCITCLASTRPMRLGRTRSVMPFLRLSRRPHWGRSGVKKRSATGNHQQLIHADGLIPVNVQLCYTTLV